jgi:hypothetical protein
VHDSRVALPLTRISAQRVDASYELMDAAYCSTVIREDIESAGRVPLIEHNPPGSTVQPTPLPQYQMKSTS